MFSSEIFFGCVLNMFFSRYQDLSDTPMPFSIFSACDDFHLRTIIPEFCIYTPESTINSVIKQSLVYIYSDIYPTLMTVNKLNIFCIETKLNSCYWKARMISDCNLWKSMTRWLPLLLLLQIFRFFFSIWMVPLGIVAVEYL